MAKPKKYPDDPEFEAAMAALERLCPIPDEARAALEARRIEWLTEWAILRASGVVHA
jgi:hypothetical protein